MTVLEEEININTLFENNQLILYLFLGIAIFLLSSFFYINHSEKMFETVEQKLTEIKDSIAFYTNKLLLSLNMECNSIKTTQTTSF